MHREFALYIKENYPEWLRDLNGNRPPLSIDIVGEFLLPILERDKAAVFIVVDCLRLDQWRGLEPLLPPFFRLRTTPFYAGIPAAAPYSPHAVVRGAFSVAVRGRPPGLCGESDPEG